MGEVVKLYGKEIFRQGWEERVVTFLFIYRLLSGVFVLYV